MHTAVTKSNMCSNALQRAAGEMGLSSVEVKGAAAQAYATLSRQLAEEKDVASCAILEALMSIAKQNCPDTSTLDTLIAAHFADELMSLNEEEFGDRNGGRCDRSRHKS